MKLQKNNRIRARAAKTRFSRAAFTLMEVLLAIAMISMLAFIVVVNLDKTMSESQTKITESFVNGSLQTPLMTFKLAVGRYPTTEEGLKALLEAPEAVSDRWKGPYVRNLPADPWVPLPGSEEQGRIRCLVLGPRRQERNRRRYRKLVRLRA